MLVRMVRLDLLRVLEKKDSYPRIICTLVKLFEYDRMN